MHGQSHNSNFLVNVTKLVVFIGILSFITFCKSEQNGNQLMEPLSEADILKSDYIEPGIKWGYIDIHGEVIIDEQFDDCRNFSFGHAAASQRGLWGYIDHQGKWTVKPVYRGAWTFRDGLGRVKVLNSKYGFLDTLGAMIIDTVWDEAEDFNEGFAKVQKDNRFQYITKDGSLLSPDSWDMAFGFKNGFARVSNGGWWGLINQQGSMVITTKYDGLGDLVDNRVPFQVKGKWGYLDSTDKIKIEPIYDEVTGFQDQYAAVRKEERWFIIDQNGQPGSLDFDFIQPLGEGRWAAQKRDTFALLNRSGRMLTGLKYNQINQFHEHKAVFTKDELYGYLDTLGHHVIPNIFLLCWDFADGAARYSLGDGIGFINSSGKAIHDGLFPDVRDYSEGLARVQTVTR